ncbi:MAG TPA: biotin--[acetyl-CoA-carboxylase] ligase [Gaiellaceae bacterium]|nr:biotin--[acetyl-CoA-carboxylase] ligase [Gaiellaceae bacterium]
MSTTAASLAPEAVRPLLRGAFGDPYLYEPECPSTQDLLRGSGLPEGAVAVADHQSAGRGRSGRTWDDTAETSLLLSVLLCPPTAEPQLSLVCAAAVAETVELATTLSVQVKWPNDVMLDRRKVAGILLEAEGGAVVCGIGLNVNQRREQLPDDARTPAGSLRTVTGVEYDRGALLASLLEQLEQHYRAWRDGGLDAVFNGIGPRNFLFGRRIRVDGEPGTAHAIGRDGSLEVTLDDGGHLHVTTGEIEVVR